MGNSPEEALLVEVYDSVTSKYDPEVTPADKEVASQADNSLCFGEICFSGVETVLDSNHLDVAHCDILLDQGAGLGKLAMQVFLQYPNVKQVHAIEFCQTRANIAITAAQVLHGKLNAQAKQASVDGSKKPAGGSCFLQVKLADLHPSAKITQRIDGSIRVSDVTASKRKYESRDSQIRSLEFKHDDLFSQTELMAVADIIILETKIRTRRYSELIKLLDTVKVGARILTYENLMNVYVGTKHPSDVDVNAQMELKCPFKQLAINKSMDDRVLTTWSMSHGHKFFLYRKCR
jgi:hypothetical protein